MSAAGSGKRGMRLGGAQIKGRLSQMTECGILEPTGTFEEDGGPEYRISERMHWEFCTFYLEHRGKTGSKRRIEEAMIVAMGRIARERYPDMDDWKFSGLITRFYPIANVMMDGAGVAGELDRMIQKRACKE